MRLRFTALLTVSLLLLLSVGCTEKKDRAWEERQRVLLLEYLDRPGVTYGEITVDSKTKSWMVKDYAVTMEYDVFPGIQASLQAKSLTGFGVEFEPVSQRSLLAKKMVYEGVTTTGPFYGEVAISCGGLVIENMYGGSEFQKDMLGPVDGIAKFPTFMDVSMDVKINDVSVTDEAGKVLGTIGNYNYNMRGMEVAEDVLITQLVVNSLVPGMDTLTIEEISAKKIAVYNYQELLGVLGKFQPLLLSGGMDDRLAMELFRILHYNMQGVEIKNTALAFEGSLPPLTLKSAYFDVFFEDESTQQSWRLEGLKVAPEYMDTLLVDSPLFGFPFATYDLSAAVDVEVQMEEMEVESVRIAEFSLHDANLGGVSLSLFMGTNPPEAPKTLAPQLPEEVGQSSEGDQPNSPDQIAGGGPIEEREESVPFWEQEGLNALENSSRPEFYKDIQVKVTDKGIVKTIFDIYAVLSGIVEVENAASGGELLRHIASVGLGGQCTRFEGDMKTACLNTAQFLSEGGVVEYKLGFDTPLSVDIDPYVLLGGVPVSSTYTPLTKK